MNTNGWKLVPVKPPLSMRAAGVIALHRASEGDLEATDMEVGEAYRAMLAAAPSPAQPEPQGGADAREVAHVKETLVGPVLFVHGVEVARWLGCCHDAHAHTLAESINRNSALASAPPAAEPRVSHNAGSSAPVSHNAEPAPAVGHDGLPFPQTFDGLAWAVEFNKRFPSVAVDDALGWFCNAIMRGHDTALARKVADPVAPAAAGVVVEAIVQRLLTYSDVRRADPREKRDALRDLVEGELREWLAALAAASAQPAREAVGLTAQQVDAAVKNYGPQCDEEEDGFRDGFRAGERASWAANNLAPPSAEGGR